MPPAERRLAELLEQFISAQRRGRFPSAAVRREIESAVQHADNGTVRRAWDRARLRANARHTQYTPHN
ncbi:hypothetical protein GCM10023319_23060 [Nocardia iowensis]